MKLQQSKNLLILLENATEHYLSPHQRSLALQTLKPLPGDAGLEPMLQALKMTSSLTVFALIAEQILLQ